MVPAINVNAREIVQLGYGVPHEEYCTLCGMPFWAYMEVYRRDSEDDVSWVGYYLALRIPNNAATGITTGPDSVVCISGIGQKDQQQPRIPPSGYDIANVWKRRTPPTAVTPKLRFLMNENEKEEWKNFEPIYGARRTSGEADRFYLMHPRCWDILQQQHALVALPNKTCLDLNELAKAFIQVPLFAGCAFRPDWTSDYAGPEQFFWESEENMINIEDDPEWNFLTLDPGTACRFDELLANPPLESTANTSSPTQFNDDGGDVFHRLPPEILTEILVLLPSTSVRALQLASRKMASVHLSSQYWRSRFHWPNELCHVKLPPALVKSGQVGEQQVDWRSLCDQLLHPVGDGYGWWKNRKRIATLNKKLAMSMPLRGSDGRLKEVRDVPIAQ